MAVVTRHPITVFCVLLFVAQVLSALNTGSSSNHIATSSERNVATHDNETENLENDTDHHGNDTKHVGDHGGVHLASINFDYVEVPLVITIFLLIVALCKLGFHHANILSSKVPESCLLIILGTIVGAILHFTKTDQIYFIEFSSQMFFLYLLPPIILESAYSLHDRVFFENLGTILLYAVVGTIMNCFIIAPVLYGLAICGAMGPISITLVQCFVFGALIVAVDPVAVLAIFQEVGVNNVLYFLVFGESLLNDAVTVVIYNTMKAFSTMDTIPASQIFLAIGAFFTVSLGGLVIGILIGALCAFLTKYTRSVRVVEPLAVFSLAYASYLLAELFHFSGIISIIGCGLMQAQYAFPNISHKSHTTVIYFIKMLSATCDCIIFMFLGLSLVSDQHVWHMGFILWSIFLCLIVRFGVTFLLTFFANRFQRLRTIDMEEQFIMAYGGLRGAVAFSLVTLLDKETLPSQPMLQTTTLAIIIFTVFVQGITIKPLVKLLRISVAEDKPISIYEEINNHVTDHVLAGIEEICGHYGHNHIREKLNYFDFHYLRQWLMRDPKMKDDTIMDLYERMALQMHFESVAGTHLWTEYTSDCELYKAELIDEPVAMDDLPPTTDIGHLALHVQMRKRKLSLNADDRYNQPVALFSRGMTIGSPRSPRSPRSSQNVDRPLRKSALSDEVFVKSQDSSAPASPAMTRSLYITEPVESSKRASIGPVAKRRKSIGALIKRSFSVIDDSEIAQPSLEDVRRWLVKNPTKEVFHRKYDRNLVHEDNNDLLHHLREKQLRLQRQRISMAMRSPTGTRSPNASPYNSQFGSTDNIAGRPKPSLNVITERACLKKGAPLTSNRRFIPNRAASGLTKRLTKSVTMDNDDADNKRMRVRSKTLNETPLPETPIEGDTEPLLENLREVAANGKGVANPESHSVPATPKFTLLSSMDAGENGPSPSESELVKLEEEKAPAISQKKTASPEIMIKSSSGSSIMNRGHLERQRMTQIDDITSDEEESVI